METFPIVHVWSDIACPFCYIGKKRLMSALPKHAKIQWHSFLLQPHQVTNPDMTLTAFLAKSKGWSMEQTMAIQQQVTDMAAEDGLVMRMHQVIPANTRRAHTLLQLHKESPEVNALVENLFKAYFEDGLNIDDESLLLEIHLAAGGSNESWEFRNSSAIQNAIDHDIQQASQMGIRGVPYFYFENHFTISGAQSLVVFQQAVAQLTANQNV
jgi:predicted DsbA family dithiol-disulfide isomerase